MSGKVYWQLEALFDLQARAALLLRSYQDL